MNGTDIVHARCFHCGADFYASKEVLKVSGAGGIGQGLIGEYTFGGEKLQIDIQVRGKDVDICHACSAKVAGILVAAWSRAAKILNKQSLPATVIEERKENENNNPGN